MPEKPSTDVVAYTGKVVKIPGHGTVREIKVIGKITRYRMLLSYEIEFIRNAILNIKQSTPKDMVHYLGILDEKVDKIAATINWVLNEYGDTDPRHEVDNGRKSRTGAKAKGRSTITNATGDKGTGETLEANRAKWRSTKLRNNPKS